MKLYQRGWRRTLRFLFLLLFFFLSLATLAISEHRFADLIEPRLEATALHGSDARYRERHLQLRDGQRQVAGGDVVLTHVIRRVGRVAGAAGGERSETDLRRRRRNIVEEIEQHRVRGLGLAGLEQRLCVTHGQRDVARRQVERAPERVEGFIGGARAHERLTKRRLQHRHLRVLTRQLGERIERGARTTRLIAGERLAIAFTDRLRLMLAPFRVVAPHVFFRRRGQHAQPFACQ